ncbi:unnamed protein product [Schistosoma haematobium]|nr:unnamed protein product [Schistosoma haematobium]
MLIDFQGNALNNYNALHTENYESRLSLDKSINLLCTENATKRQKIVIFIYKTEELTKTRRCILHNEPCDWMGLTVYQFVRDWHYVQIFALLKIIG